jgi:hypothetical protein
MITAALPMAGQLVGGSVSMFYRWLGKLLTLSSSSTAIRHVRTALSMMVRPSLTIYRFLQSCRAGKPFSGVSDHLVNHLNPLKRSSI